MEKKILIIIPAFNEKKNLEKLITEIKEDIPEADYIIVNDCSTDGTSQYCKKKGYSYLDLSTNLGIGGAVQTAYMWGLEKGYYYFIQCDGDGQHDPRYIRDGLTKLEQNGVNIVIGSRFLEKNGFQSSSSRRMGIWWLSLLIYAVCGVKIKDVTSGFRFVDYNAAKLYATQYQVDYPEPEAIVSAVLAGMKVMEFPVKMRERVHGESSIQAGKSIYYMVKVSLSILILRLTYFLNGKK